MLIDVNSQPCKQLYGFGGSQMKQEGLELLKDTSKISSIGLIEALPYLWASWSMIDTAIQRVIDDPPVRQASLVFFLE